MIFDLFHSISDPVIKGKCLGASRVFSQFMDQVQLAEGLGFDTVWCAESHFSSEVQKQTSVATIPHFAGEVGLNCDSFQLAETSGVSKGALPGSASSRQEVVSAETNAAWAFAEKVYAEYFAAHR